ncbi:MAG: DinB family protein [Anaerolineae bacterium]
MIKAILLDLDNTLLVNPDRRFAQAFLTLFEAYWAEAGMANAGHKLRQALKQLSSNQAGNRTNQQIIIEALGDDTEQVNNTLAQFYRDVYPALKGCISAMAGAVDLIEQIQTATDWALVIATNPIYPDDAIRQRMAWAGLPSDDERYALITSAENMHFAKPDPAYYAEILGRVGVEPDEALMIGDGLQNDINPAQAIGIHTFQIGEAGLKPFVKQFNPEKLSTIPAIRLRPHMIEPQLRGNIGAVYGFIETVQPNFWQQRPDPEEWSILQILSHLIESEEQHERQRLLTILQEDNPFLTQSEQPGPDLKVYNEDGYALAEAFMRARQETISLIETFNDTDWRRPARHSIFGLTTMLEMSYFTAQHDRLHLNQLCHTIGRCE